MYGKAVALAFTMFAIVIVAAAVAGFAFKKNGELAGLGRTCKRRGLRAPHGRLVRTKRLDAIEETSFANRLLRVSAACVPATAILLLLCAFGLLSWEGTAAVALDVAVVVCASVVLSQSDAGVWRPLAGSMFGFLIPGAVLAIAWVAGVPVVLELGAGGVNALTMVFGTVGAVFAIAGMPAVRTYAREFEDGYVNVIQVSGNSVAARAYDAVADPSWKPPADRIKNPEAAHNPRAFMRRG